VRFGKDEVEFVAASGPSVAAPVRHAFIRTGTLVGG
jgi:hypothetical protein